MNLYKKLLSLCLLLSILLIPSDVSAQGQNCSVDIDSQITSRKRIVASVDWSTSARPNNTRHRIVIRDISSDPSILIHDTGFHSAFIGSTNETSGIYHQPIRVNGNFRLGRTYSVVIMAECGNSDASFDFNIAMMGLLCQFPCFVDPGPPTAVE